MMEIPEASISCYAVSASSLRCEANFLVPIPKAGHDRHADVAQYQVGLVFQYRKQAFLTVVSDSCVESALDQLLGNQRRGFAVILDAEDFDAHMCHARPPSEPSEALVGVNCDESNKAL
jgi:hypothetical protein